MHICVVGSGYVGLVTGTCFAEFGVDVTCVDNDDRKVAALQRGQLEAARLATGSAGGTPRGAADVRVGQAQLAPNETNSPS